MERCKHRRHPRMSKGLERERAVMPVRERAREGPPISKEEASAAMHDNRVAVELLRVSTRVLPGGRGRAGASDAGRGATPPWGVPPVSLASEKGQEGGVPVSCRESEAPIDDPERQGLRKEGVLTIREDGEIGRASG